jgi:hypothetical protein
VVPLKKEFWEMKNFRTVQYAPTAEPKATLERYRAVLYEAKLYRSANATRRVLLCPGSLGFPERFRADNESSEAVDRHDELG